MIQSLPGHPTLPVPSSGSPQGGAVLPAPRVGTGTGPWQSLCWDLYHLPFWDPVTRICHISNIGSELEKLGKKYVQNSGLTFPHSAEQFQSPNHGLHQVLRKTCWYVAMEGYQE